MDESQRLEQARNLIVNKRYHEARAVLQPIAHNPTAQTWLAKLDEIAPLDPFALPDPFDDDLPAPDLESAWGLNTTSDPVSPNLSPKTSGIPPYSNPWNPQHLTLLIFFFSPAALVVFSLNWRRLGRPKWALPSFLFGLTLLMIPIGFLLTAASFDLELKGQNALFIPLLGGYVAYYVFLFGSYFYQNREYKRYLIYGDVGGKGRYRSDYYWLGGAAALLVGGLALAITLFTSSVTQPVKIDTPYLTVERPYDWTTRGRAAVGYCANYEQGCFLNISYAGPETREMVFIYFPLNGSSHQAIVNRLWQEYLANYRDVRYGPQTTHTVDGDEFTFQEFVPPNLYSLEGYHLSNYYSAHGYVAVADGVIEITFWASSEAEFRDSYGQFIDILDSIDLKHRVAMPITSQGSANE